MPKRVERLYITLTNECNMTCPHCWVAAGPKPASWDELGVSEHTAVIDALLDNGLKTVKVTGGEPFVRKEVLHGILLHCQRRGLEVNIETNGTLIDANDISIMKSLKECEVSVSLDYPDSRHDKFRRAPHAFEVVSRNIRLLNEAGLAPVVITAVHRDNFPSMRNMADYALNTLGCPLIKFVCCIDIGRAVRDMDNQLLTPKEVMDFYEELGRIAIAYPQHVTAMVPYAFHRIGGALRIGVCEPSTILGLLPNGDVAICGIGITNKGAVLGNVKKSSIRDIVEHSAVLRSLRVPQKYGGICGICIFRDVCANVCPAHAFAHSGSYSGAYPVCQVIYEAGLFPSEFLVGERIS